MKKRKREALNAAKAEKAARQTDRVQRAREREVNAWDETQSLYASCAQLLAESAAGVDQLMSTPELFALVEDKATLNDNVALFSKDMLDLSNRLLELHKQHEDRTGPAKNDDDYVLSLQIDQQYIQFTNVFQQAIQPVFNLIMESFAKAEIKLRELAADVQRQAQDPNHTDPIDVQAVDASTGIEQVDVQLYAQVRTARAAMQKDRTLQHVELDPNDPNPQATIEQIQQEAKSRRGETSAIMQIDELGVFPTNPTVA